MTGFPSIQTGLKRYKSNFVQQSLQRLIFLPKHALEHDRFLGRGLSWTYFHHAAPPARLEAILHAVLVQTHRRQLEEIAWLSASSTDLTTQNHLDASERMVVVADNASDVF